MNGKRAKAIREEVYGDYSPKFRKYYKHRKRGTIICEQKRQEYQKAKQAWTRRGQCW